MYLKPLLILICLVVPHAAGADSTGGVCCDSATLKKNDLVDVQTLDSSILVHLVYGTAGNFMGKNVYGSMSTCYLRREAAEKLAKAQMLLAKKQPGYHLLVYDGLRPRRIQQIMWDIVKGTPQESYVAKPNPGGLHNYGAAVDLTIADASGRPIDMGTPFDYLDVKAQPRYEALFLDSALIETAPVDASIKQRIRADIKKNGLLSALSLKNRRLLREIMVEAGFLTIPNEWWHFNSLGRVEVRKRYTIIE